MQKIDENTREKNMSHVQKNLENDTGKIKKIARAKIKNNSRAFY